LFIISLPQSASLTSITLRLGAFNSLIISAAEGRLEGSYIYCYNRKKKKKKKFKIFKNKNNKNNINK
jgi:hypothetical protein